MELCILDVWEIASMKAVEIAWKIDGEIVKVQTIFLG